MFLILFCRFLEAVLPPIARPLRVGLGTAALEARRSHCYNEVPGSCGSHSTCYCCEKVV